MRLPEITWPKRVWERQANGKYSSREVTKEDKVRRAEVELTLFERFQINQERKKV